MLKIGICTERIKFGSYVEELLGELLYSHGDWEIGRISSEHLMKGKEYLDVHVFCLDERLITEKGCNLVKHLNRIRPEAVILLLEGEEEQGLAGIRYHLFAYGINRMRQPQLKAVLDRQWYFVNTGQRNLLVKQDGKKIPIPISQILYVESRGRKMVLHTMQGEFEYTARMRDMEQMLQEEGFIRCHRSFLVSTQYITEFTGEEVRLNPYSVPVGRVFQSQLEVLLQAEKDAEREGVFMEMVPPGQGMVRHIRPEQKILVGRDPKTADIVVNLPEVSRLHLIIVFHGEQGTYDVMDVSKNGTYLPGKKRLVPDVIYTVKAGTEISLGGFDHRFYLG